MSKPKTSYTATTRNKTSYTATAKNSTSYSRNTSPTSAWFLNSTFLTLSSTLYRLNGYLTAAAPNQLDNKNATAYTAV